MYFKLQHLNSILLSPILLFHTSTPPFTHNKLCTPERGTSIFLMKKVSFTLDSYNFFFRFPLCFIFIKPNYIQQQEAVTLTSSTCTQLHSQTLFTREELLKFSLNVSKTKQERTNETNDKKKISCELKCIQQMKTRL